MPVSAALAKDAAIVGPLGSLALSGVRAASPMMVVRTLRWYRDDDATPSETQPPTRASPPPEP